MPMGSGTQNDCVSMITVFQESFLGFLGAVLVVCSAKFHLDFPSTNIADIHRRLIYLQESSIS